MLQRSYDTQTMSGIDMLRKTGHIIGDINMTVSPRYIVSDAPLWHRRAGDVVKSSWAVRINILLMDQVVAGRL